MACSYPFLAIARKQGVSYGDVLSYADAYQIGYDTGKIPKMTHWQLRAAVGLSASCQEDIQRLVRVPIEKRHLIEVV